MAHNISRGWLGRVITVTLLAGFVPVSTAACFGSFPITRRVYRWNLGVHHDKWIRWLVFVLINVVPVYAGDAGDEGKVVISPRVEQNLGIRTAEVTKGNVIVQAPM